MNFKKSFLYNLKSIIIVLASAGISTFIFSLTSLFFDREEFDPAYWTIDITVYSYFLSILYDWLEYLISKSKVHILCDFSNPSQKNNQIVLKNEMDNKTIKLSINIKGKMNYIEEEFKIIEPHGMTLQIDNPPDYLLIGDNESYYTIDFNKIISNSIGNIDIRRSFDIHITLDSYDDDFSDILRVTRQRRRNSIFNPVIFKQKELKIKN